MKNGIKNIAKINVFILGTFLYILIGLLILLIFDKSTVHFTINKYNSPFFDVFFKYLTYIGDGLVTVILVLLIGWFLNSRFRLSTILLGLLTLFFTGLMAQFLKRMIYPEAERPLKYLGEKILHLVPDVDVHLMNSFPSGHTATGFAFFAFLAFLARKQSKFVQVLCVIMAILIAYSRMYLSQHFLEDTIAGAFVGILAYLIAHLITTLIPFKNNICRN